MLEDTRIIGNVVVYSDNSEILYFGYFGVDKDQEKYIQILINEIKHYAESKKFNLIRGPINIPTIIFGWGFSKEESKSDLFIGKPTTLPIYYKMFLENGFIIKYEELTHETPMYRLNPYKIKKYDFSDYAILFPTDYNDLINNFKDEILRLHAENMPPSAKLNPDISGCFNSYADFVIKYGSNYMFVLVKHIPKQKHVAAATCIPDIFNKQEKGIVFHSWAVDRDYRRKGLAVLMSGSITLKIWKKYTWAVGHTGAENRESITAAQKLAQKITRSHLILDADV